MGPLFSMLVAVASSAEAGYECAPASDMMSVAPMPPASRDLPACRDDSDDPQCRQGQPEHATTANAPLAREAAIVPATQAPRYFSLTEAAALSRELGAGDGHIPRLERPPRR